MAAFAALGGGRGRFCGFGVLGGGGGGGGICEDCLRAAAAAPAVSTVIQSLLKLWFAVLLVSAPGAERLRLSRSCRSVAALRPGVGVAVG